MATQLDEGYPIEYWCDTCATDRSSPLIERSVGVVHVQGQCARPEQAPSMLAEIRFGNASHLSARRGRTDFVRPSRDITRSDICIDLELRSVAHLVETIAHELGHVVEQLDDVELTPDGWHGVGPCDLIAQRLGGTVSLTLTPWLPPRN